MTRGLFFLILICFLLFSFFICNRFLSNICCYMNKDFIQDPFFQWSGFLIPSPKMTTLSMWTFYTDSEG